MSSTIAVVGAGNMGMLYASMLGLQSELSGKSGRVVLVSRRQDLVKDINGGGLALGVSSSVPEEHRHGLSTVPRSVSKLLITAVTPSNFSGDVDVVVGLTSIGDLGYALEFARSHLVGSGLVLLLQNGLASRLAARGRDWVPSSAVLGATYLGATVSGLTVTLTHPGITILTVGKEGSTAATRASALLRDAGLEVSVATDEATALWDKLLMTCINWVCGSIGMPIGRALQSPMIRAAVWDVIEEVMPIAVANGARMDPATVRANISGAVAASDATGSTYMQLTRGIRPEVIDICEDILEAAASSRLDAPRVSLLRRLLIHQHWVNSGAAV